MFMWHLSIAYFFVNSDLQGLRAFVPKAELVTRVNSFTDLKENVSCSLGTFLPKKKFFLNRIVAYLISSCEYLIIIM